MYDILKYPFLVFNSNFLITHTQAKTKTTDSTGFVKIETNGVFYLRENLRNEVTLPCDRCWRKLVRTRRR